MSARVAIVYDCLYPINRGGGERVYRRIAELLEERGARVDYLTRRQWQDGAEPAVPFRVIPIWGGEIYDAAGNRTTKGAIGFAAQVARHLGRNRDQYDLVIASALPVLTLLAARLALLGTPTRVIGDWLEVWGWRKWRQYAGLLSGTLAFLLQWLGIRVSHGNTVNSRFTARRLTALHRAADPLVLGLVDLVDLEPRREPAAEPHYLLTVGRHIPDKRVTAIPAALAQARALIPDLRAVVVGDGPETPALRRAAAEHGVLSAVEIPGRVDDARLGELLAHAAVLVHPSAREGFGLVIAEAAAHGVPSVVVAGSDNAAVDLVEEGVNGFVAASVQPGDLAAAILTALRGGPRLRASTGKWFEHEREHRSLRGSVDELLRRHLNAS